ncbi:MAG: metallophosphoesterase [Candidatus Bathyarchaeia archaeon]|jgi:calcineurin-like phosphoesterase family protein
MNSFFTTDTHLSHQNIIKYCNRPFSTVEEMDETIIANINGVVSKNDLLYHLGDFAWGSPNHIIQLRHRIKCKIILILGNHDKLIRKQTQLQRLFTDVYDIYTPVISGIQFVLCHYCMRIWPSRHHGAKHLFGHSHGTLIIPEGEACMDVGVDTNDFKPYSLDEIMTTLKCNQRMEG